MKTDKDSGIIDQKELNFIARISCESIYFDSEIKVLFRKRDCLNRAVERLKKSQKDLYDYECEYVDAMIDVRRRVDAISSIIKKYEDYKLSSKAPEKRREDNEQ
jgi:long-subunit acyl-CoA synthetase (AMP-forming)